MEKKLGEEEIYDFFKQTLEERINNLRKDDKNSQDIIQRIKGQYEKLPVFQEEENKYQRLVEEIKKTIKNELRKRSSTELAEIVMAEESPLERISEYKNMFKLFSKLFSESVTKAYEDFSSLEIKDKREKYDSQKNKIEQELKGKIEELKRLKEKISQGAYIASHNWNLKLDEMSLDKIPQEISQEISPLIEQFKELKQPSGNIIEDILSILSLPSKKIRKKVEIRDQIIKIIDPFLRNIQDQYKQLEKEILDYENKKSSLKRELERLPRDEITYASMLFRDKFYTLLNPENLNLNSVIEIKDTINNLSSLEDFISALRAIKKYLSKENSVESLNGEDLDEIKQYEDKIKGWENKKSKINLELSKLNETLTQTESAEKAERLVKEIKRLKEEEKGIGKKISEYNSYVNNMIDKCAQKLIREAYIRSGQEMKEMWQGIDERVKGLSNELFGKDVETIYNIFSQIDSGELRGKGDKRAREIITHIIDNNGKWDSSSYLDYLQQAENNMVAKMVFYYELTIMCDKRQAEDAYRHKSTIYDRIEKNKKNMKKKYKEIGLSKRFVDFADKINLNQRPIRTYYGYKCGQDSEKIDVWFPIPESIVKDKHKKEVLKKLLEEYSYRGSGIGFRSRLYNSCDWMDYDLNIESALISSQKTKN